MNLNEHRTALLHEAVEVLNKYSEFSAEYRVSFALTAPFADGVPRIAAKFERTDERSICEGSTEIDKVFMHLNDQTALIRPFFIPMLPAEWDNRDVNEIQTVDFDYAAIIGYGKETDYFIKALYLPPTEAMLSGEKRRVDGSYKFPLATYTAHQMSLDPREKFARFLYLSERMTEALAYQYQKYGRFYSVQPEK